MALKEVVNKLCRSYKTNWNKLALPLALVAGLSFNVYASTNNDSLKQTQNQTQQLKTDQLLDAEFDFVPFKDFYPKTQTEKITIEDKLKEYLDPQGHSFDRAAYGENPSEEDFFLTVRRPLLSLKNPRDIQAFESTIIAQAKRLGYSLEKLKNLSVHDAVRIASQITDSKMDYDPGLAGRFSKADAKPVDEILNNEKGVCRHFSYVNSAVFNVLKNMNQNLNNVYMSYISFPDSNHAINQVVVVTKENNKIKLSTTLIEPQYGEESLAEEKILGDIMTVFSAYVKKGDMADNASLLFYRYLADLYMAFGNDLNMYKCRKGEVIKEAEPYYTKATEYYSKVINQLLKTHPDNADKDWEYFKKETSKRLTKADKMGISAILRNTKNFYIVENIGEHIGGHHNPEYFPFYGISENNKDSLSNAIDLVKSKLSIKNNDQLIALLKNPEVIMYTSSDKSETSINIPATKITEILNYK